MTKRSFRIIFGWILLFGSLFGVFFFGVVAVVSVPILRQYEMLVRIIVWLFYVFVAFALMCLGGFSLRLIQGRQKNLPWMDSVGVNRRIRCSSCGAWIEIGTRTKAKCSYCGEKVKQ